jgi:hypothetical protein
MQGFAIHLLTNLPIHQFKNNMPIFLSANLQINLVDQLSGLPVDQLRLPHPDKSGFAMTKNVSPPP